MSSTTQTQQVARTEEEMFEQDYEALRDALAEVDAVIRVYRNTGRHRQVGIRFDGDDVFVGVLNHNVIKILQEHNFANVPQISYRPDNYVVVYAVHDTSESIDEQTLR
jgi:hypothetical protein